MHKKHTQQKDKIVELKQLVSQPECLKLLILHTPFNLNIDSLHQCINLVKLDLSKNNLTTFPYLGELPSLKFMFIHENKLDIDNLIGIFQENVGKETKSALSKSIIWVTYWGNKSQFNARHYMINHTSVLAVDHHMVVPEEKNQAIFIQKKFVHPFDPITDISEIFHNRKKFNKNATQQQYMAQFWQDMAMIRKKHVEINLVIKIQRLYRGWIYRLKQTRQRAERQQNKIILDKVFKGWKRESKFTKKLRLLFKKMNKQYMLLPLKQMKLEAAKRKIIEYVQSAKKKIILRKMNLKSQYKFFNVLKSNQQALRSLYSILHLDRSEYIMVHVEGLQQFKKYVIPVASSMNGGIQIAIEENKNISLRNLYQPPRKRRQFLRLLEVNQKSIVFQQKQSKQLKHNYNYTVYKLSQGNLSNIYNNRNIHFSQTQKQRMQNINKSLIYKRNMDLNQLKKVKGDKQVLKDIVRGVYFYNMGYLTNCNLPTSKINILSDFSIKKTTAILKIQRVWRGISFRRKIMKTAKVNYRLSRAAVKIQRWFRNLQWNHRRIFMFDMCKYLRNFHNDNFYIKMDEYMELLSINNNRQNLEKYDKMSFPQQNILPFISKQTKKMILSWDVDAPNEGTFINNRIGKKLFTSQFIGKVFDTWPFLNPIKFGEQKKYDKCQISHLFHYQTQISLIHRKNGQYIEIKCASKYECRLRILALKLLTYKFNGQKMVTILPSQSVNFYQSQLNFKKTIKNPTSIFISQVNSEFQIQAATNEDTKNYEYFSKFYISQANQKPAKYSTNLRIIMIDTQQKQKFSEKRRRSISHNINNEKFDIEGFLITETNDIKLDRSIRQSNINQQMLPFSAKGKKQSLKNIKVEKKLKVKNREKVQSLHSQNKDKFNFMLGDPHFHERLTTQPDLTHERSVASIVAETDSIKKQISKSDIKIIQNRALVRKRIGINNESSKAYTKNMEEFTKNFINQGNFIQSQFLYGQIKRLKTQIQRNSVDQAGRIKTEQKQINKYLQKFKDDKLKRAHEAHQKHKQQQYRSMVQRRSDLQIKIKNKNQNKQTNYKSLPRKMRINFAEECYPIIGKYPVLSSVKREQ